MRHPLIHQGEGPAAAIERITAERQHHRRELDRIRMESAAVDTRTVTSGAPAGDEMKLRGIPAIGRSVAGAIPGTNPETELLRRCPRR